jgi:predicted amidohydrolase YtcJ
MADGDALIVHGVPCYVRPDLPPVEAIGILDGRVAAAGPLGAVRTALPPTATIRRLSGGAVLPAFIDAHQHASLVAADPQTDALYRRAPDVRGLVDVIAQLIAAGPPADDGGWLRFHGYEPLFLAERRSPTAAELDRAYPDRPLHVLSRTFHESAVNSAGLAALGIGAGTPDPPGGLIPRDRRGRPTGVLIESASFAAEAVSRPRGPGGVGAWRERLRAHGRRLLSLGIVRIGDAAVPASSADAFVAELAAVGVTAQPLLVGDRIDEPALVPGGTAKVLLDGGEHCHLCMTSRQVTSLMRTSVAANLGRERDLARAVGTRAGFPRREADGLWHTGVRSPLEADLGSLLRRAAEAGSGLAVHAIGNGSVDALLDARGADPGAAADVPVRIEHAIAVDPALATRLGRAGLPVVAQPGFLTAFGHELAVVPLPRPLRLMPFRMMIEAGVPLAFSSDHPGADLAPWQGVHAAVTRLDRTGRAILPDEAIGVAVALAAWTSGGARVLGVDDAGTLEPGMVADIMWCDRDPMTTDPATLAGIAVRATWSAGRLAHEASPD